jgi:hypothetical protein
MFGLRRSRSVRALVDTPPAVKLYRSAELKEPPQGSRPNLAEVTEHYRGLSFRAYLGPYLRAWCPQPVAGLLIAGCVVLLAPLAALVPGSLIAGAYIAVEGGVWIALGVIVALVGEEVGRRGVATGWWKWPAVLLLKGDRQHYGFPGDCSLHYFVPAARAQQARAIAERAGFWFVHWTRRPDPSGDHRPELDAQLAASRNASEARNPAEYASEFRDELEQALSKAEVPHWHAGRLEHLGGSITASTVSTRRSTSTASACRPNPPVRRRARLSGAGGGDGSGASPRANSLSRINRGKAPPSRGFSPH